MLSASHTVRMSTLVRLWLEAQGFVILYIPDGD